MLRRNLCSLAVASAFASLTSPIAYSQDQITDENVEKIQVTGIRGSMITAQDIKRAADTVKDVISADDIGALPDRSVTEALMRVPGVTIERFASSDDPNHFAAEGTGVVVRGLKRVRSEINGRDSFSASTGGGLNYQDIPGELLGRIEVVKNHTADLIAGGVAGTVNLVTRKAFDSAGFFASATAKGSYADHREEWTPILSSVLSNRWETDFGEFGVLLSGSSSEFKDRGDGVAMHNYYERSATAREMPQFGNFGTALDDYPNETRYVPADASFRTSDSERKRKGLAGSFQYRNNSDTFEFTAEFIRSTASLGWDERIVQQGEQGFNVNPNDNDVADATFDDRGFMTSGTLRMDGWQNRSLAQSRYRFTEQLVEDSSLNFKFNPTDDLTVEFDYQHVESEFDVKDYTLSNAFINNDHTFDIRGGTPVINYFGDRLTAPASPELTGDVAEMYINSAMDKEDDTDAESDSFAADLEYNIEHDWITSVQVGAYKSTKKQTKRDSKWNWGEMAAGAWAGYSTGNNGQHTAYQGTADKPGMPELYEVFTFNANDFHGGGVLVGDQSFLFPRLSIFRNWQEFHNSGQHQHTQLRNRSYLTESGETIQLDGSTAYLPAEISNTKEDRLELYTQVNFDNIELAYPIKGNLGLRYVSWQVESTGATQFPDRIPGWDANRRNQFDLDQRAYQNALNTEQVTVKGDKYTKLLPSFNVSMELDDDTILRFAVSENIYLPNFERFRYYRRITESHTEPGDEDGNALPWDNITFDGTSGNPQDVEPEEATSIDLTYEWYMSDSDSLTFSLFHKKLKNIIRQRLFTEEVTNVVGNPDPDPESVDGTHGPVTFPVNFQSFTNQGSGTIQGFEVAYTQFFDSLPGVWSGLGLSVNYTYLDQKDIEDKLGFGDGSGGEGGRNRFRTFTDLPLPGYSDDTINVTALYEKNDISARIAYNWRSEYLLTRRDSDLFAPVMAESTGQLDASVSYSLTDNIKVGLEATNLLDEIIETKMIYNQAGDTTTRSHFKTDRRFGAYVSVKF